jgi:D-alanine transaminase
MSSIVYLNGEYVPRSEARISVMDRGFLFGDGIYEIIGVYNGRLFRSEQHLERLQRSLMAIKIEHQFRIEEYEQIIQELLEQNNITTENKYIYIQVTRGISTTRSHNFPKPSVKPSIFMMLDDLVRPSFAQLQKGFKAITREDSRWKDCFIKTISLLPNVLLSEEAIENDATETILIHNGYAIEGSNSNLFNVKNGVIITPPKSEHMLGGITRELIIELAQQNNLPIKENNITLNDLYSSDEIWVTSASRDIMPIVNLDDQIIANGQVGPMWQQMQTIFQGYKDAL